MKRIFGGSKPQTPGPSLDEASKALDTRVNSLDEKIKKLDQELYLCKDKMNKMKPGSAPYNSYKQKALKILKQKKMYETQRDQMMGQSFNMEQANFTQQSMKDTVVTVGAMKSASVEMKKQFKQVNMNDIDQLQDDMEDLMTTNNEIQDALGRSYAVDVDESELEDELAALQDEMTFDTESPSYLTSAAAVPTGDPSAQMMVPQQAAAMQN